MKIDLRPILAAILREHGEIRIKPKFGEGTTIIDSQSISEFEEISFDPDWIETAESSGTAVYFPQATVTHPDGTKEEV